MSAAPHPPPPAPPASQEEPRGLVARARLLAHRVIPPSWLRFVKFGLVGASGVVVNLAFVWVGLAVWAANPEATRKALASALGIAVSVFTNFLLNDAWTWADRHKGGRRRDLLARVARYYFASGAAIALQYGVAMLLAQAADWNLYLAQLVGIALGTVVNYVVNNIWTFRDQ